MNEKLKAFEAAIEACKTALDVCEDVICIEVMRGYVEGDNLQVSVMIDKDPDGLLKDVEPEQAGEYYLRFKMIGNFRVSSCNIRANEVTYRERHGLPPLPPVEGQEAQETGT